MNSSDVELRRDERSDGLREINDQQTVAFDRNAVNLIDASSEDRPCGQTLRGGLVYAGGTRDTPG